MPISLLNFSWNSAVAIPLLKKPQLALPTKARSCVMYQAKRPMPGLSTEVAWWAFESQCARSSMLTDFGLGVRSSSAPQAPIHMDWGSRWGFLGLTGSRPPNRLLLSQSGNVSLEFSTRYFLGESARDYQAIVCNCLLCSQLADVRCDGLTCCRQYALRCGAE